MELSAIVPLPIGAADNKGAAFDSLSGEAPLVRVVRAMAGAVAPPRVVVATAEPLIDDVRTILAAHDLPSVSIAVAAGVGRRSQCLVAGLKYLEEKAITHVLVHDVSRPLVPAGLRDRVIAGLRDGGAVVVPALPVTDSVKSVDTRGSVTGTLDRSMLRAVQYPRGFAADQLIQLLARSNSEAFDELEEALRAGVPITMVEGDPDAFVVELPRDARFVEAIIASRPPDSHH